MHSSTGVATCTSTNGGYCSVIARTRAIVGVGRDHAQDVRLPVRSRVTESDREVRPDDVAVERLDERAAGRELASERAVSAARQEPDARVVRKREVV
jgi:hypothetical protein